MSEQEEVAPYGNAASRATQPVTPPGRHPAAALDDVVHQRTRLGILAILAAGDSAEFTYLKQALELTDGNLNRHIDVLAIAGLVVTNRTPAPRKRTVVGITAAGRAAFDRELRYLSLMVATTAPDATSRGGAAPSRPARTTEHGRR